MNKTSTLPEKEWSFVSGAEVRDTDLLLGRGIGKDHKGNIRFKNLIAQYKYEYLAAPKALKPRVAFKVVKAWREIGGRFLERIEGVESKTNKTRSKGVNVLKTDWFDVGDKKAREKASMSLRERTPEALTYLQMMKENRQDSPVGPSSLPQDRRAGASSSTIIHEDTFLIPSPTTSARKPLPPPRNILLDTIFEKAEPKMPPIVDRGLFVGLQTPIQKTPSTFRPKTIVEAQQHAEIQAIKNSMHEQQKQIEDLKQQLASLSQSAEKASAASIDNEKSVAATGGKKTVQESPVVKPSLLVSPVPHVKAQKQHAESPMAIIPNTLQDCFCSDAAPLSSDEELMLAPTPLRPRRSLFTDDGFASTEQTGFPQGTTPLKLDSTLAWLKWTPEKYSFGVQSPLFSSPLSPTPKKQRDMIPSIPALKGVSRSPEFSGLKRRSKKRTISDLEESSYPEAEDGYRSIHAEKTLKMNHFESTRKMAYASMTSV